MHGVCWKKVKTNSDKKWSASRTRGRWKRSIKRNCWVWRAVTIRILTVELRATWCLNWCSHMSSLSAKRHQRSFVTAKWRANQRLGWEKDPIQDKRGNSEVHNIWKCKCCQTPHFNAKGRPGGKHCCAGWRESAHPKHSGWNSDQAGREQRCVHDGHVDLPCWNWSGFQLAGTVSGQAAFDKLVRPAALYRGVTTETEKQDGMKKQNWMELKNNVMRCQMKKEMRLTEKRS